MLAISSRGRGWLARLPLAACSRALNTAGAADDYYTVLGVRQGADQAQVGCLGSGLGRLGISATAKCCNTTQSPAALSPTGWTCHTALQIKEAFRRKAKLLHPDAQSAHGRADQEEFVRLLTAYQVRPGEVVAWESAADSTLKDSYGTSCHQ